MDLSDFQRKAVLLIFISILIGSILLARKEPLKEKGVVEQSSAPAPQKTPIPKKIDINTADISIIMQLPGIGPGLAKQIINNRPYSTIDDLLNVPGIGEKRLSRIKEFIELPEGKTQNIPGSGTQTAATDRFHGKLDLNKATAEQLSNIPSIGPILAQAITDYREKIGKFKNLDELVNVPRIGQKTYEKIKAYLYIENPVPEATPQTTNMAEAKPRPLYDSRIDPKVKCPYCGKQLWEKGERKQEYIRCPHCLKLLNE